MIDRTKVAEGAVRKTAPYWLIICATFLLSTLIPNAYVVGALLFVVVVLMVAATYVQGFSDGLSEALPDLTNAAEFMEDAAKAMEKINAPYTLTGGGPLDGDTLANPIESPRLAVYDPETEQLEGFYLADSERPNVLVWLAAEEEDDDDAVQEP